MKNGRNIMNIWKYINKTFQVWWGVSRTKQKIGEQNKRKKQKKSKGENRMKKQKRWNILWYLLALITTALVTVIGMMAAYIFARKRLFFVKQLYLFLWWVLWFRYIVITEAIIAYCENMKNLNLPVSGPADGSLREIRVVFWWTKGILSHWKAPTAAAKARSWSSLL